MAPLETSTRSGRTAPQVHALAAPSTRFANWNFCNFWRSAGACDTSFFIQKASCVVQLIALKLLSNVYLSSYPIQSRFHQKVLCGQEGRPNRRRQNPSECESHGCNDVAQLRLQGMLSEFVFGFDSDFILRALLQLVCEEQPSWLLLPLQSMLSRLIVEHGQVICACFSLLWHFLPHYYP